MKVKIFLILGVKLISYILYITSFHNQSLNLNLEFI